VSGASTVLQVGLDHRSAPREVLEAIHGRLRSGAGDTRFLADSGGAVRLVTCHRVELYCEDLGVPRGVELFGAWLGLPASELVPLLPHVHVRVGAEAGRHLLRVAAGLESAVLGEDQVLAQAREAYRRACDRGEAGPLLHRLFHVAFRAGKRVRNETGLGHGLRSLAGAAVAAIARELGGLGNARVLVIGTGDMARLAAARLAERGVAGILVASRTPARAESFGTEVGAEPCPWEWRRTALGRVDAVVCATRSEEPAIRAAWLEERARQVSRRLVVVDLGAPRSVEAPTADLPGLRVFDLATLSEELQADSAGRIDAVHGAEAIVEEELGSWMEWVRTRQGGAGRCGVPRRGELVG